MSFGMDSFPILRACPREGGDLAQLRADKAGAKTPKDRTRSPETKPKQPLRPATSSLFVPYGVLFMEAKTDFSVAGA